MNQTVYCHLDFEAGHDVFGQFVSVDVLYLPAQDTRPE